MSTKDPKCYDWLPIELQLTGYDYYWYRKRLDAQIHAKGANSIWISNFENELKVSGSKRYYMGTPEILRLLDGAGWPPENPGDFLFWDPEKLETQRREMTSFLYGKIGAFLYPRHSADLNLFDLCWKDVIHKYVRDLPNKPNGWGMPEEFTHPEKIGLPEYRVFREVNDNTKQADEELIEKLTPATAATFGDLIRDLDVIATDHNNAEKRNRLKRDGASPELGFLSTQSDHPFLKYVFNCDVEHLPDESLGKSYQGISGTCLPAEIEAKINANMALQLRLKLWWGWPGAPFMCMENMMVDSLAYLVREGYLRYLGGLKYELPEEKAVLFESQPKTLDRLKEALKLLTPGKAAMTVGSTLAKGALSASAPYWIDLGRHLLRL
jgi:hypothetical protein